VQEPFATAMGQSVFLPAAVLLIGLVAVLCFAAPTYAGSRGAAAPDSGAEPGTDDVGAPAEEARESAGPARAVVE